MSNEIVSQGGKVAAVSRLLDAPDSDSDHPVILGEKPVRQVPKRAEPDLFKFSPADLKGGNFSPVAEVAMVPPIPDPPPQVIQRMESIRETMNRVWGESNQLMDRAEQLVQAGDFGGAAYLEQQAAAHLASVNPLRQEFDQFSAYCQKAVAQNNHVAMVRQIVSDHPWIADKGHFSRAMKWAMAEFDLTEQQIMHMPYADFKSGCESYEAFLKSKGKRIGTTVKGHFAAEKVLAKARAEKKRTGRLSKESQVGLISELLRDLEA